MNRRDFLRMTGRAAIAAAVAGTVPSAAWAAVSPEKAPQGISWTLAGLEWDRDIAHQVYQVVAYLDIHNGPAWFTEWVKEQPVSMRQFLAEFHIPYNVVDDNTINGQKVRDMFDAFMRERIDIDVQELTQYADRWQWQLLDPTYQYTPHSWASIQRQRQIDMELSDLEEAEMDEEDERMHREMGEYA